MMEPKNKVIDTIEMARKSVEVVSNYKLSTLGCFFQSKRLWPAKRMSNTDLATMSGISRKNISAIMSPGTCSIPNAGWLADAIGVLVDEICKEE